MLFFEAPSSFTGEDVVELQVHGNPLLVHRLLEHLGTLGVRMAEPGEFARRAILNGRMSVLEAEGLRDLIGAATDAQLRQAQARSGGVPPWILQARESLRPWLAQAEAAVDYGEEEGIELDLAYMQRSLEPLRCLFHVEQQRAEAARWIRDGIALALVGRPNAGKSTLFNQLAGDDRAIVTEVPGTTRDVLEVRTEWRGIPLRLYDTAGLRMTEDPVERLGVARVERVMREADLVLHLVPVGDRAGDPQLLERLRPYAEKCLEVRTHADLGPSEGLRVSAVAGDLDALEEALKARFLGGSSPDACLGALATVRQRELLKEMAFQLDLLFSLHPGCPPELPASVLQGAWGLLARLTGEDRAETTLDALFSGFCLGK